MSCQTLTLFGLAVGSAALLAGYTTTQYAPRFSYYRVPWPTPGGVLAPPIGLEAGQAVLARYEVCLPPIPQAVCRRA